MARATPTHDASQGATTEANQNSCDYWPLAVHLSPPEKTYSKGGDCILLPVSEKSFVLLDSGYKATSLNILTTLADTGRTIEGVILTHLDGDHTNGFSTLLELIHLQWKEDNPQKPDNMDIGDEVIGQWFRDMDEKRKEVVKNLVMGIKWVAFTSFNDPFKEVFHKSEKQAEAQEGKKEKNDEEEEEENDEEKKKEEEKQKRIALNNRMVWLRGSLHENKLVIYEGEEASMFIFKTTYGRVTSFCRGYTGYEDPMKNFTKVWYFGDVEGGHIPNVPPPPAQASSNDSTDDDSIGFKWFDPLLFGKANLRTINDDNESSLLTLYRGGKGKEFYYLFTGDSSFNNFEEQIRLVPRNIRHLEDLAKSNGYDVIKGEPQKKGISTEDELTSDDYEHIYKTFFGYGEESVTLKDNLEGHLMEIALSPFPIDPKRDFDFIQLPHHGSLNSLGAKPWKKVKPKSENQNTEGATTEELIRFIEAILEILECTSCSDLLEHLSKEYRKKIRNGSGSGDLAQVLAELEDQIKISINGGGTPTDIKDLILKKCMIVSNVMLQFETRVIRELLGNIREGQQLHKLLKDAGITFNDTLYIQICGMLRHLMAYRKMNELLRLSKRVFVSRPPGASGLEKMSPVLYFCEEMKVFETILSTYDFPGSVSNGAFECLFPRKDYETLTNPKVYREIHCPTMSKSGDREIVVLSAQLKRSAAIS